MKVAAALSAATARLAESSETPRLDAELLMALGLGVERDVMLLHHLDNPVPAGFEALLQRREASEPVAYITGSRGFWTIELEVGPGALVPRPDSETLIEVAAAHFKASAPRTILDLGTGPGSLLLAALDQWHGATGLGIDRSEAALGYARRNAQALGMAGRAAFRLGDWSEGVATRFDLVLCNPPYVEAGAVLPRDVRDWEPGEALFAGADGLDAYRRLAPAFSPLIADGGLACVEIGAGQADAVERLFADQCLEVARHQDLGGHVRCLALTRASGD